jgi:hypothetical protein
MLLPIIFLWIVCALIIKTWANNYHRWKHGHPLLFVFVLLLPMLWVGAMIGQTKLGESCWGIAWLQKIVYFEAFADGVGGAYHVMFIISAGALMLVAGGLWIAILMQVSKLEFARSFAGGQIPLLIMALGVIFLAAPLGANFKAAGINLRPTEITLAKAAADVGKRGVEAVGDLSQQMQKSIGRPQSEVVIPDEIRMRFASTGESHGEKGQ